MALGNAYTTRMPGGFPGDVNRTATAIIEPGIINQTYPPTAYGQFTQIVSGQIAMIQSGASAAQIHGPIVRPFPVQETYAAGNEAFMAATPDPTRPCDILRIGYMTVLLQNSGAVVKGQAVYVRVTVNGANAIGQIESAADSGKCVAVTGAYFNGPADSYGNVEIVVGMPA